MYTDLARNWASYRDHICFVSFDSSFVFIYYYLLLTHLLLNRNPAYAMVTRASVGVHLCVYLWNVQGGRWCCKCSIASQDSARINALSLKPYLVTTNCVTRLGQRSVTYCPLAASAAHHHPSRLRGTRKYLSRKWRKSLRLNIQIPRNIFWGTVSHVIIA